MRKRVFFLCSCALLLAPSVSAAQTFGPKEKVASESLPPIIILGLETYKTSGPEEAVRAWIKGSALDGSKDALSQADLLRQIQDYYGTYRTFEIVRNGMDAPGQSGIRCARVESARPTTTKEGSVPNEGYDDRH